MSVRKHSWIPPGGEEKTAWMADYMDGSGKGRQKPLPKKDADLFAATASIEVLEWVPVADSATVSVKEVGQLWLRSCANAGLEHSTW